MKASYYRPTGQEVLEDYLKAVDPLTINNAKTVLTKQVAQNAIWIFFHIGISYTKGFSDLF
jgi:hypothetical protein